MNYHDELYNLVNEIHAKVEGAKQAVADAQDARTTRPLPGGLGEITIAGSSQLVDVSLDVQALKAYTATSLAQQLLHGIHAAENDAATQYAAAIALSQEKARIV